MNGIPCVQAAEGDCVHEPFGRNKHGQDTQSFQEAENEANSQDVSNWHGGPLPWDYSSKLDQLLNDYGKNNPDICQGDYANCFDDQSQDPSGPAGSDPGSCGGLDDNNLCEDLTNEANDVRID